MTDEVYTGEWKAGGLCNCFSDCGVCCKTFFCPCVTYGEIKEALHGGTAGGCCGPCCLWFCMASMLGPFVLCITVPTRNNIRKKYSLAPTCDCCGCGDCCTQFWCHSLALCQERRELKSRPLEPWPVPVATEEGTYVPPQPEAMPTV